VAGHTYSKVYHISADFSTAIRWFLLKKQLFFEIVSGWRTIVYGRLIFAFGSATMKK
jgi:hypothetical protein